MVSLENTLQTQTPESRISQVLLLPLLLQLLLAYKTFRFPTRGRTHGKLFRVRIGGRNSFERFRESAAKVRNIFSDERVISERN